MNFVRVVSVAGLVTLGLAIVASGQPTPQGGGFEELYRVEIAESPELEVVMGMVTRSGAATSPKHFHPQGEFGLVLEGEVSVTAEDQPPVIHKAGTSFYQPPGKWHVISTSSGGTKAVVFRVVRKGEPMVVGVDS